MKISRFLDAPCDYPFTNTPPAGGGGTPQAILRKANAALADCPSSAVGTVELIPQVPMSCPPARLELWFC